MIIRYSPWNKDIEMGLGEISFLIIENPGAIDKYVSDIYFATKEKDGAISLIEDGKEKDISKYIDIISSPNDLSYDSYSFKKKLYQQIVEDNSSELEEIAQAFQKKYYPVVERLFANSYYDLDCDYEINETDILEMLKVTLKRPEGFFVERLCDYMKTISNLMKRRLFVLINCSCYLDKYSFDSLKERITDEEIAILMVDHCQPEWLSENQRQCIIDISSCEITNDENHRNDQCSNGIYSEIII